MPVFPLWCDGHCSAVIPAKAGIHLDFRLSEAAADAWKMDSSFRWNDGNWKGGLAAWLTALPRLADA
jgi:hypothetical protein